MCDSFFEFGDIDEIIDQKCMHIGIVDFPIQVNQTISEFANEFVSIDHCLKPLLPYTLQNIYRWSV